VAQVGERHAALEKIEEDNGRWTTSLAMLRREQEEGARLARKGPGDSLGIEKSPSKEKQPRDRNL
jgi:hypothetical protein